MIAINSRNSRYASMKFQYDFVRSNTGIKKLWLVNFATSSEKVEKNLKSMILSQSRRDSCGVDEILI